MRTDLLILRADGTRGERSIEMAEDPRYAEIRVAVWSAWSLGRAYPEHVAVLHEGKPADMFVHEDGHGAGLPRNEAATTIYRASWLERHPSTDPESLPWIAGDAVVFGRLVWS